MDSGAARLIGARFEALLLERALSPMKGSFGEFGSIAVGALAESIAQRDRGGFGSQLAALLERRHG